MNLDTIKSNLNKIGITAINDHVGYVNTYKEWFEASVSKTEDIIYPKTNSTTMTTVAGSKKRDKYFLNPQKLIAKKFASLMFNENTEFLDADKKAPEEVSKLQEIYTNNGFWQELEKQMLDVFGIGHKAITVEYDTTGVCFNSYDASNIFPITIINGQIIECVFMSTRIINGKTYTIFNVHLQKKGGQLVVNGKTPPLLRPTEQGYIIRNYAFDKNNKQVDLTTLGFSEMVKEYEMPCKMFVNFKPFNRNIDDLKCVNNAIGIPIYYDSLGTIKSIDETFDQMYLDIITSRRIITMSNQLIPKNEDGRPVIPTYAENILLISSDTEQMAGEGSNKINEFAPIPKCETYMKQIQESLNRLSVECGLGTEEFLYGKSGIATATQIISQNQEKFVSIKKHESTMSKEFINLNRAILATLNIFEQYDFNLLNPIGFKFQDSVIIDDETRRQNALAEVQSGVMSKERYLTEFSGLEGEELTNELARIKEENKAPTFEGLNA